MANLYTVDPQNSVELSRLLRQDDLLTKKVSGFFPANVDEESIHQVLDVGCGPGGWLINLVRLYDHVEAVGVDKSEKMIEYAQNWAELARLSQARFIVDSFDALPFPDASFDFVNARLVQWFIPEAKREGILREWFRVLRPGGWLRFVEADYPQSNGQAGELITELFVAALRRKFGPQPFYGIPYEELDAFLEEVPAEQKICLSQPLRRGSMFYIRRYLEHLGCQEIETVSSVVNYGARGSEHDAFVEDIILARESHHEFLLSALPQLTRERLASLAQASIKEMESPDFIGMQVYLSAWGRKPTG